MNETNKKERVGKKILTGWRSMSSEPRDVTLILVCDKGCIVDVVKHLREHRFI